jgi:DNA-directed RNA polymerase specialized sigma24 family protein
MPDPELRRALFDALFREHHPAVQAYARRRVPPEFVDDIASETFPEEPQACNVPRS